MNSDMFLQAFIGGALIGLGSFALMLFSGRIAGVSGITYGAIFGVKSIKEPHATRQKWRVLFVLGLIIAPLITGIFGFSLPDTFPTVLSAASNTTVDIILMIISGLLVGFGTHLGSGCTSGHGICGISRLSIRSITATCLFMLSAMITVAILKYVSGGAL